MTEDTTYRKTIKCTKVPEAVNKDADDKVIVPICYDGLYILSHTGNGNEILFFKIIKQFFLTKETKK